MKLEIHSGLYLRLKSSSHATMQQIQTNSMVTIAAVIHVITQNSNALRVSVSSWRNVHDSAKVVILAQVSALVYMSYPMRPVAIMQKTTHNNSENTMQMRCPNMMTT